MSDLRLNELLDAYDEAKAVHAETVSKWRLLTVVLPLVLLIPFGAAIIGAVGATIGVNTGPIAFVFVPFGLLAALLVVIWFGITVPREQRGPSAYSDPSMARPAETKARMRKAERAYTNHMMGHS